jgi:CRISPR-associated DxTHG motif protein
MILYSFLGLGKYNSKTNKHEYDKVKYSYNNQTIETEYFPEAAEKFLKPEKVIIVFTEKSKQVHSETLSQRLKFDEIIIPDGKTESEFWEIFSSLSESIKSNSEIALDITHGFRSQPILALATILYLQSSSGVNINKIIYGAYEAKDENNIVPVFDLSVFVNLIRWSGAVRDFLKYQNAYEINNLLKEIHTDTYINNFNQKSESLESFGRILNELSLSLSLSHIPNIFNKATNLSKKNDLQNIPHAAPLATILKKISDKIEPISNSDGNWHSNEGIKAQLSIIQWYLETSNYQQAITLMRELLITVFAKKINLNPEKQRKDAEEKLGKLCDSLKETHQCEHMEYVKLFNQISEIRNEINHAAMRTNITRPSTLVENINNYYEELLWILFR